MRSPWPTRGCRTMKNKLVFSEKWTTISYSQATPMRRLHFTTEYVFRNLQEVFCFLHRVQTGSGISAWWRILSFELISDLHLKRRKWIKWTAVLEACPFRSGVLFISSPLEPILTKSNQLLLQSFIARLFPPRFVRIYHDGERETVRVRCRGDWSVDINHLAPEFFLNF
jgi:hypothetical protein